MIIWISVIDDVIVINVTYLHITNIFDKASQRLSILRILKYKLNMESLIKIYISFIRPILEYDVVWDNSFCTQEQSNFLETRRVQIEARRIISGLRRTFSRQTYVMK